MSLSDAIIKTLQAGPENLKNADVTIQPWTPELIKFLAVSILVFCGVTLAMAAYLLKQKNADSSTILKVFGIVAIICMSAFLMVVGYGNEQLTPVVGLFGAIAGYLLGKDVKS